MYLRTQRTTVYSVSNAAASFVQITKDFFYGFDFKTRRGVFVIYQLWRAAGDVGTPTSIAGMKVVETARGKKLPSV